MKGYLLFLVCSISLFGGSIAIDANAQAKSADAHVAAAKTAAAEPGLFDLTPTFSLLCDESRARQQSAPRGGQRAAPAAPRVPERSEWYVEPVKVFDNLYSVGTSYYVWAATTSGGIILLNAGKEYAADAVPEGLQKMGLPRM